jgi:CheY-like chemotaxis protein
VRRKSISPATLEYSALTAGHLKLDETEFGLSEMVDSVLAKEREKAQLKGLKLTTTLDAALPQTIVGDATRIQDLLGHLVDNAIKFTHHGGVDLKLTREDQVLKIEVRDTGIGIDPDRQARIFESFHQVDSGLSRNYSGLGLGLALAQKLLALMGGQIAVESALEKGSTFTIRLPIRLPGGSRDKAARHLDGAPAILAVEDNPVGLKVLRHALKSRAVNVDTATDGAEAIRAAAARHYDLILMDLQMPDMDGLEATAAVRRLPGYENVPILALTANYSDEIRKQCQEHGMQDFLSKPVTPSALWAAVSHWLNVPG